MVTSTFGQIEHITISSDSSIIIDKVYAGMLSSTAFNTKNVATSSAGTFRVGVMASWKCSPYLTFHSFGMFETDLKQPWGIQQFYLNYEPTNHWIVTVGQSATISTEQRPHPVSGAGQFETWTQSRIPGGAPGIKIKYRGNVSVGAGIAARNGFPEYHASVSKGSHTLSGYYLQSDYQSGFAYTYDTKKLYAIVVCIPDSIVGSTVVVRLKKNISLFADVGYGNSVFPRAELGAFKSWSEKWIKGLLSVSYDVKIKSVKGYLFVHL